MSYEESLKSISLDADDTIGIYTGVPGLPGSAKPNTGKQYTFVKVTGIHQAGLAGTGDKVIGVLQNKPQEPGAAATIGFHGVSNVQVGAEFSAGDLITQDANGAAITGDSTNAVGIALDDGVTVGSIVPVLLTLAS